MPNAQKIEKVAALKERIEGADAMLLTEYRGLTVSEIAELRRSLRGGGTSFAVIKNTLMKRAAAEAGIAELEAMLEGPSAVAFVDGDPVAAAKKVTAAAKQFPALVLKGGFMDGKVLSADEAKGLADLESREVMLSQIAGLLKSDLTKAATLFVSAQSKFVRLLEAHKAKLPVETEGAESEDLSGATEAATPEESLAPASEELSAPDAAGEEASTPDAASEESSAPDDVAGGTPDETTEGDE